MPQNTSFNISKEANKELNLFKTEQELGNKSKAVIIAISKARKYDEIKYSVGFSPVLRSR